MAIVINDGDRLYLTAWEYNAARIMTALADIVTNNNGKVKPTHTAIISNRAITSALHELEDNINRVNEAITKYGNNDARTAAIANYMQQINEFKAINNNPITVTHTSYISFVLNDMYYYYQVDSNPFFEFYYQKTPVNNGKRSRDAALEADKKEWLYDCFFGSKASQDDVKEAANMIFNMLCNAANSTIMRDKKRQQVQNTYNDGYHMETVYAPERIEKLDF